MVYSKYKSQICSDNLQLNEESFRNLLGTSADVKFKSILINRQFNLYGTCIYIDGMIDMSLLSSAVFKPINLMCVNNSYYNFEELITNLQDGSTVSIPSSVITEFAQALDELLSGSMILLFSEYQLALSFEAKGFEKRSITESSSENVIKGSKDTFVETLRTNTATIRRKIKSPELVIEELTAGTDTHTAISIVYIKNIIDQNIINTLRDKLNSLHTESLINLETVELQISDNRFSMFPQAGYTERADKFCSNILEGYAGILIDGIPFSLIVPGILMQFLQAPEDYNINFVTGSLLRILRYFLLSLTLILPAFYICITSFHHEMIPAEFALFIASSQEGVPFPSFLQVFFLLIGYEILQEAGIRLPKTLGQTISIIGTLILGQAAVEAKLVSPAIVVLIALTGSTGFTIPNQDLNNAVRVWRFIFIIASSIFGLVGLSISILFILYSLCRIDILGMPYLSPFNTGKRPQLKDTFFRVPFFIHENNPNFFHRYKNNSSSKE